MPRLFKSTSLAWDEEFKSKANQMLLGNLSPAEGKLWSDENRRDEIRLSLLSLVVSLLCLVFWLHSSVESYAMLLWIGTMKCWRSQSLNHPRPNRPRETGISMTVSCHFISSYFISYIVVVKMICDNNGFRTK